MKTFSGSVDFRMEEDTVLAIGKFDGLHRGHELLLSSLRKKKEQGLLGAIFTFDIPPMREDAKLLSTNEEKQELFSSAGIDAVIECPFTEEVKHMEPDRFLRMLKERARVRCIVAGEDCRFGYRRAGDASLLCDYAKRLDYEAIIVKKMQHNGRDISSTYIRERIVDGDIKTANFLLGYPYFVSGIVLHGNRIGRTISMPTMNLIPPEEKLLPPFGVYVTRTFLDGKAYPGISNVGVKPTVGGDNLPGVETHLFDFDRETYGKAIRTEFLSFLRPEKKFDSLEELKAQMQQDMQRGRAGFAM